jgi:hypothetical protein
MFCNGCGQALVVGQGFCPRCGRASGLGMPVAAVPPAYGFWPPLAQIEQRVNSLAIGWFVYAGIVGITGLIGLSMAHAFLSGHDFGPWYGHGHRFFDGPMMPLFFLRFARIALFIRIALALAAGYGLYNKTTWGRILAIIAGCLALIHPILGTALGIWTLVVLLKAPNAAGYEAMAR